jgi:NAD(P)-dependent dehydrogenase (short-subunit alcohol dehydrogenase family)
MEAEKFKGKTALITGANRGIGKAIALALAEKGADVVATVRSEEARKTLTSEIGSVGENALVVICDVAKEGDIKAMVEDARKAFGKIDIAVCNAGVVFESTIAETSTEDWDNLMSVNLRGVFLTIRESLKVMPEKGDSKILIISSNSGMFGQLGFGAYCASKHGLMGLADTLSQELKETEIGVNVICPGRIITDMSLSAYPDMDTSLWLQVEEVANSALFLLSLPSKTIISEIYIHPRFQIVKK